ncbi:MAG: phosphoribosyltransferase [Bacteroidetes bacterium]|nr:phosphoribosyltransferase [Bacteroidota bacterium]
MAEDKKSLVLSESQIRQKIRRMAYQIYENNIAENSIVFAGIEGQGYSLARELEKEMTTISPIKIQVVKVAINKDLPQQDEVTLDVDPASLRKKVVVLIDDVLNTGRVLTYAMKPLLNTQVSRIEVAVLVNRSHPQFPVQPTYTGYALSTTLSDHVEVNLSRKPAVYLH